MKDSPSAGFTTHIAQESLTLTMLIRFEQAIESSPTVLGITAHDADLAFDDGDGSITYRSDQGTGAFAIASSADSSVDNTDVGTFFDAAGFTEADVDDGLWDFATVKIYLVNFSDLTQEALKVRRGFLGEMTSGDQFIGEIRGMLQRFLTEIVDLTSPYCRSELGETGRCKIDLTGTTWSASLAPRLREDFNAGDLLDEQAIKPTTDNDRWFISTNGGLTGPSEPSWDTTIGNTTTETLTTDIWVASTSYPAGSQILENSLIFVSDGGTSDTGEPTWPSNPGDTVADNDIIWTAYANTPTIWKTIRARRITAVVATVTNSMEFTITPDVATDAPDAFFQGGRNIFTSGNNSTGGLKERGISAWTLSTLTVKSFQPMYRVIQVGDALDLIVGCDKIRSGDCTLVHDNVFNLRGEPDLPGNDQVMRFTVAPSGG